VPAKVTVPGELPKVVPFRTTLSPATAAAGTMARMLGKVTEDAMA
jgi:hypothetical protein